MRDGHSHTGQEVRALHQRGVIHAQVEILWAANYAARRMTAFVSKIGLIRVAVEAEHSQEWLCHSILRFPLLFFQVGLDVRA
jgi:hypothetical protein